MISREKVSACSAGPNNYGARAARNHIASEEILHALGKLFPLDAFQACAKLCKPLIPHIQRNMYKWHAYCDNCAVRQAITSDGLDGRFEEVPQKSVGSTWSPRKNHGFYPR